MKRWFIIQKHSSGAEFFLTGNASIQEPKWTALIENAASFRTRKEGNFFFKPIARQYPSIEICKIVIEKRGYMND